MIVWWALPLIFSILLVGAIAWVDTQKDSFYAGVLELAIVAVGTIMVFTMWTLAFLLYMVTP